VGEKTRLSYILFSVCKCVCVHNWQTICFHTILQLTQVGTRVHTIVTSDPDIGDAGSVEFFIVSNGDIVTVSVNTQLKLIVDTSKAVWNMIVTLCLGSII